MRRPPADEVNAAPGDKKDEKLHVTLVHARTRCRQRPRHTNAPAARNTARMRYSSPRQRRPCHAAEPAVEERVTPAASSTPPSPDSCTSSCSCQVPAPPPSHHSRSPWTLDSTRPWAVWACRLASYSTFWLAHPRGRCTWVASPSSTTASPERVISASRSPTWSKVVPHVT